MDKRLLAILCCPTTHKGLSLAKAELLKRVNAAIATAFEAEGADAWFADDGSRFLEPFGYDPARYEKVTDILDVWFDSGSTHSFTLEKREDLAKVHKEALNIKNEIQKSSNAGVPWHPGALKYFKEKGLKVE